MRLLYTFIMSLLLPMALLRLLWRSRQAPAYRQRWRERLGWGPAPPQTGGLWIHAVSVGEVQAIAPLIRQLLQTSPEYPVCVTTTTPTGSAQVSKLFAEQVFHVYLPYDLPVCLNAFLNRVKPNKLLMVETEVWPNLLYLCRQRGIHTLLANARMSVRSQRGYWRLRHFSRQVFGSIDQVAAQTEADAQRLIDLGVAKSAVQITGSIKFDTHLPASMTEQAEVMRLAWRDRPVWIAASTHHGEDEIILAAHQAVLTQKPDALLILVPRHPERFTQVAALINSHGFSYTKRSQHPPTTTDIPIYLGDTMGELPMLIGSAQVAFIGGSLVNTGGHNMLEAAAQGVPTCFGPHTFNFANISEQLIERGAARRIQDAESLSRLLIDWLSDASQRTLAGEAGRQLVEENRGALQRLARMVN